MRHQEISGCPVSSHVPVSRAQAHSKAGGDSAQAGSVGTRAGDAGVGAASRVPFPSHGLVGLQVGRPTCVQALKARHFLCGAAETGTLAQSAVMWEHQQPTGPCRPWRHSCALRSLGLLPHAQMARL